MTGGRVQSKNKRKYESILGLTNVSMRRRALNYNEYPNFRQFPWRY